METKSAQYLENTQYWFSAPSLNHLQGFGFNMDFKVRPDDTGSESGFGGQGAFPEEVDHLFVILGNTTTENRSVVVILSSDSSRLSRNTENKAV